MALRATWGVYHVLSSACGEFGDLRGTSLKDSRPRKLSYSQPDRT
jgi:hypothetical protein